MNDKQMELLQQVETKLNKLIDNYCELRISIEDRNRLISELRDEIQFRNEKIDAIGEALLEFRDSLSEGEEWKRGCSPLDWDGDYED